MLKARPALVLLICITGIIAITVLEILYKEPLYSNSGLLLILLLTIFLEKGVYTYVVGFLSVVIIMASLYTTEQSLQLQAFLQQLFSAVVIVVACFVVLHIKKLYRSIEGEKVQMNALLEYAREGILLINSKGEIVLVNPEAQRLFQYEINEMIGQQIELLIPRRFLSAHIPSGEEFNEHTANLSSQKSELYAVKKSGVEFPVELNISNYQQYQKQFALVFITDITQRKESEYKLIYQKDQLEKITRDIRLMNVDLENKVVERTLILQEALHELERSQLELNEALSKEKELNEIKSRFVSMASHEFRTPLSTVLSSAAIISKYRLTEEQEKREKHVLRIKDSIQHLNALLEDFLNLGRLEEGRLFTQVVEFDVKEFLHDVFDEMKIGIKQGQQLKLFFEGESQFITDKRLLKNILINLLGNAIKFSGENKNIEITIENSGVKLLMQIKDEGIGISKEDMPYLFSTFYRGKNAVNIQGTGLGLHIVKRYIDMLEGSITLSSELNEGTTFNIGLPNLKELALAD
ncbi:MAG: PAS domain-containing sensor histidine kinase [Chitinophagaceae bacterium]